MQIGVETSRAVENKRVFVIHSNEILRAALQFMLHDDYEAHELATIDDAYIKSAGRIVDLVLLDVAFVNEAGTSLLKELSQRLQGAKILLVSPKADAPLAQTCLKEGADDVLPLPLTLEVVRRKANTLVGRPTPISLSVLRQ